MESCQKNVFLTEKKTVGTERKSILPSLPTLSSCRTPINSFSKKSLTTTSKFMKSQSPWANLSLNEFIYGNGKDTNNLTTTRSTTIIELEKNFNKELLGLRQIISWKQKIYRLIFKLKKKRNFWNGSNLNFQQYLKIL